MAVRIRRDDREYVVEPGEELQTDLGVLSIPVDVQPGDTVETHLGTTFDVRSLRGPDLFDHLERTGAPMIPRDIGLVIGETGIQSGDRVLDVGTGTGVLSAYLGRCGAIVVTYEQDAEAAAVARENMALAGVEDRVEVREGDATVAIDADELEPVDVLTLDTGDAPTIIKQATKILIPGGMLAAYSPYIEQTRTIVEAARESLTDVRAIDTIQRPLDIGERGTRPSTGPVGHTGYLIFARRP